MGSKLDEKLSQVKLKKWINARSKWFDGKNESIRKNMEGLFKNGMPGKANMGALGKQNNLNAIK